VREEVRPEDTYQLPLPPTSPLIGTTEVTLVTVPAKKRALVIYGILLNNHSTASNILRLRRYAADGTTLEQEWAFMIGAIDTIDIVHAKEDPILVIPPGKVLKVVADAASVMMILQVYER